MEIKLGKVVGRTEGSFWGQVHDFVPNDQEKRLRRGRLLAVLGIKKPDELSQVEMVATGREILARLHEEYYGEIDGGILERLKLAVERTIAEYEGLEVTSVVISEKVVYAVSSGGGIRIWNNGGEGWLVDPENDDGIKAFSGWGSLGEMLVLGNAKFWQGETVQDLREVLKKNGGDLTNIADDLIAVKHINENGGGEAAILVSIVGLGEEDEVVVGEREVIEKVEPVGIEKKERGRLSKLVSVIGEKWHSWRPVSERPVYVVNGGRQSEDKGVMRKRTMWVGVGLGIIMVTFLVAGKVIQQKKDLAADQTMKIVAELENKIDQAQALVELNPERTRELTGEVEQMVAGIDKKKLSDEKWRELEDSVAALKILAEGKRKGNAEEVIDLSWLREGSSSDLVEVTDKGLVVLDRKGKRLFLVDPDKQKGEVIAGGDVLGEVKLMATYPGRVVVFSDKGIVQCVLATGKCGLVIKSDSEWQSVVGMKMFGGNIYLLDQGANQIWRYAATVESGFGSKQAWVAKGEEVELADLHSLAVDGDIWMVGSGGAKLRMNRGTVSVWTVSGLGKAWGSEPMIYTNDESENLYILDNDNHRVIVLDKEGKFKFEVEIGQGERMNGITVDEGNKYIYLAGESKVWRVTWSE